MDEHTLPEDYQEQSVTAPGRGLSRRLSGSPRLRVLDMLLSEGDGRETDAYGRRPDPDDEPDF